MDTGGAKRDEGAVVELAVGKTHITKENLTLTTWHSLGDQPPKTPPPREVHKPAERPA